MTLEFNWWDDDRKDPPDEHQTMLALHAAERAAEMLQEGMREGELITTVTVDNIEYDYQGWWKMKYD